MKSGTAITLAGVVKLLTQRGLDVDLHNIDAAEIVTARDMFANMILFSDKWDGLFFLDSDMRFEPTLVGRMLDTGADVVGTAYTRRALDLEGVIRGVGEGMPLDRALARASEFNFKAAWEDGPVELKVENGFVAGAAFGMGCAIITKRALTDMIDEKVVRPRLDLSAGPGTTCWSWFEPLEHEGTRLGEDYSFCYRWNRQMGRELLVCIDERLGHIGGYEYGARYLDLL